MEPITAALAVSQLAIQVGGLLGKHAAEKKLYEQNKASALRALSLKRKELSIRGIEETISANQQIWLGEQRGQATLGAARASAAGAGVTGNSVDALMQSVNAQVARYTSGIEQNLVVTQDQLARYREQAAAEAQARINSAKNPNTYSDILGIGGAALDAYTYYKTMTNVGAQ